MKARRLGGHGEDHTTEPCLFHRPQDKTRHLKHTLNAQFRMIHELCTFVLLNTRKESLVRATLTALHAYLSWVPVG